MVKRNPMYGLREDQFEQKFALISRVYCAVFRRDPSMIYGWLLQQCRESETWCIMYRGKEPVGIGCWTLAEDPIYGLVQLRHIGVVPGPKNRGLGRRIVDRLEQNAMRSFQLRYRRYVRRFILYCRSDNIIAQNMYRKCGYIPVGTLPRHFGDDVDAIVFAKTIR